MVIYGSARQRQVDAGIARGDFVVPQRHLLTVFTAFAVPIAGATLALIVVDA